MKAKETKTLNVRLPSELVDWLDSLVEQNIFNSRSEIIRSYIRDYVKNK